MNNSRSTKSEWIITHYIYLATVYSISISKYDNAYMWYYYIVCARVRVNLEVLVCHCSPSLSRSLSLFPLLLRVCLAYICISLDFCYIYIVYSLTLGLLCIYRYIISTSALSPTSIRRPYACLSVSLYRFARYTNSHAFATRRSRDHRTTPILPFRKSLENEIKKPIIVLRPTHHDRIGKWQHCRV